MSMLCLNVCRLCVPNIMSLGVCFIKKKLYFSKLAHLLDTASKFALFSVSGLKDIKLIKKQAYTKTETCKLDSRIFGIFLPNFNKIDRYNFELYRLKVGTFFETRCTVTLQCTSCSKTESPQTLAVSLSNLDRFLPCDAMQTGVMRQ